MTTAQANRGTELSLPSRWHGAIAFEWTKITGVRSTWLSMIIALVVTVALSVLFGASAKASGANGYPTAAPAPHFAFQAILVAEFLIIVVATLFVTSEYSSRSIVTTLQGVPERLRLIVAKLVILAALSFVAGIVLSVLGTLAAAAFAGSYGTYTARQVVEVALASGLYLALIAMLAAGLGFALRSAAGTITSVVFLLLVFPQVLPLFGIEWLRHAADYLPSNAAMVLGLHLHEPYGQGVAVLVVLGWTAAATLAGSLVLRLRDA